MSDSDLKIVCSKIDAEKVFLNSISQKIWKTPELKFDEVFAHKVLTDALVYYGFDVQKSYLLPTAFRAEFSSGKGPTIAVMLEYDALPEIGHACGHNLIAEAGLAAGIAIKAAMEDDKSIQGKLVLMGSPAEEEGGGKIVLLNRGAFKGIDAAMMVHPGNVTLFNPSFLSRQSMTAEFKGKEVHAALAPWDGINALDAAVILYQSIGLLRQQTKPTYRIHAIISKGGTMPNVIPADTAVSMFIRAPTKNELVGLKEKIIKCIKGAAEVTGCTYSIKYNEESQYDDVVHNKTMSDLFSEFSQKLGMKEAEVTPASTMPVGSTDMGNVSYVAPSIHPLYSIDTPAFNHTKEFTTAAGLPEAQTPTLVMAKAMAMTALALMRDPQKMKAAKEQFDKIVS